MGLYRRVVISTYLISDEAEPGGAVLLTVRYRYVVGEERAIVSVSSIKVITDRSWRIGRETGPQRNTILPCLDREIAESPRYI